MSSIDAKLNKIGNIVDLTVPVDNNEDNNLVSTRKEIHFFVALPISSVLTSTYTYVCMYVCMCMSVCACLCVWEREREIELERGRENLLIAL